MNYKASFYIISLIFLFAISFLLIKLYVKSEYNEFHRSKMIQYQYVNSLQNFIGTPKSGLLDVFNGVQCKPSHCYVLSENVVSGPFFRKKNFENKDFFGVTFYISNEGVVTRVSLYKP